MDYKILYKFVVCHPFTKGKKPNFILKTIPTKSFFNFFLIF